MPTTCRKWLSLTICGFGVSTVLLLVFLELNSPSKKIWWYRENEFLNERQLKSNNEIYAYKLINAANDERTNFVPRNCLPESNRIKPTVNVWQAEEKQTYFPSCPVGSMLLILVTSSPEHYYRRSMIRKTWGKPHFFENFWCKTYFMIGQSSSVNRNLFVENESSVTGDILIGNYRDSYRNLTYKVLNGISWALNFCRPKFILKTDDDCFVNAPLILEHLVKNSRNSKNVYVGRVNWDSPVIRDRKNNWFVEEDDFKESVYPPYASGIGYIISQDVLIKMLKEAELLSPFPNEDAYIGVLARNSGIEPTSSARFAANSHAWQICNFLYLMVIHHVQPAKQKELINLARTAKYQCIMTDELNSWH